MTLTSPEWLLVVGLAVEGFGILLTIRGLIGTWRSHSRDPLWPAWTRFMQRVRTSSLYRGLLTLKAKLRSKLFGPQVVERAAVDGIAATGFGWAQAATAIAWSELPADPREAVKALGKQTENLREWFGTADGETRKSIDQVRSDLGLQLSEESSARAATDLEIATGGVKTAIKGLLVTFVGIVLQGAAVIWAAQQHQA